MSSLALLTTVLGLLLGPAPGAPAEAAPPPACPGAGVVQSLLITGCEDERCGRSDMRERLRSLTDLQAGTTLTPERVERARQRLLATGLVAEVTARCGELRPGRFRVELKVVPQRYVSAVHIEGHEAFFRSEIEKRLLIEPGVGFTPGTEAAARLLAAQRETLDRLYREAGFADPKIDIEAEPDGGEGVAVTLRITEGRRKKIGAIQVDAAQLGLADDEALHCSAPVHDELRKASGIKIDEAYTDRRARDARRRLRRHLQARGYLRPKVEIRYREAKVSGAASAYYGSGVLTLRVRYEGCYLVHIEVREAAGDPYRPPIDDGLLEALSFGESGSFDWQESVFGRQLLVDHLQAQGYLFAEVKLDYRLLRWSRRVDQEGPLRGWIGYKVTTGALTEIRDVRIEDLPEPMADEAMELMETRPYDFFSTGGYLQMPRVIADLERIARHMRDNGYLAFAYGGAEQTEELVIRRSRTLGEERFEVRFKEVAFEITRPRAESYIYLRARSRPGQRTIVGDVHLYGNLALDRDEVLEGTELRKGAPFVRDALLRDLRRVRARYQALGHAKASVSARCSSPETPHIGRISCMEWTESVKRLTVHLSLDEGPRLVVGELLWSGNFRTRDAIVLRDLPSRGEPFDAGRIRESLRKLRRLGVFNAVRPIFVGLEETPPRPKVAIMLQLHESPARFVDLALGVETISRHEEVSVPEGLSTGLQNLVTVADRSGSGQTAQPTLRLPDLLIVGEVAYIDENFLGRAQEIRLPARYGLSTTQLNRLVSVEPTWINRRLFGSEVRLQTTPFVLYDRANLEGLDTFKYGVEFGLSQRFFERILLGLKYEISRVQTRRIDVEDPEFGPFSLQNKVRPQVIFDFLDSPVHPTTGQHLAASVAYINSLEEGEPRNFLKFDVRFKIVRSLRRTLIFGLFMRYGHARSFQGDRLPENERFVLGGNKGVRGFDDNGVLQYNADGNIRTELTWPESTLSAPWLGELPTTEGRVESIFGGDLLLHGSLEMRFPILRETGLWGGLFYDLGALTEGFDQIATRSFRHSVGGGIRYLIGNSIPLRLDYGVKLDRRCASVDARGRCLRNESFGNLHFGILYTF